MIQETQALIKIILDYARGQLALFKRDGVVIVLDGTLMSIVNVLLVRQSNIPHKIIFAKFTDNDLLSQRIFTLIKEHNIVCEFKNLTTTYAAFDPYGEFSFNEQVALKKRLTDAAAELESDKINGFVLGNLCYSQWCINFPHKNYKNLNHLYLLTSLYYKEVQQIATYLNVNKLIIGAPPTYHLHREQLDETLLGYTYDEQESFLKTQTVTNAKDQLIQQQLQADDRHKYLCPIIHRPSNILI